MRGIRVLVIPLALSGKEEMKQSNVLIEDKSTLISFAVLMLLCLLLLFLLFTCFYKLPFQVKCKVGHDMPICLNNFSLNRGSFSSRADF